MIEADDWAAYFRERSARQYGSDFYLDENGREVEATCLGVDPDDYRWPDKVSLGRVVKFVRRGRVGTVGFASQLPAGEPMLKEIHTRDQLPRDCSVA